MESGASSNPLVIPNTPKPPNHTTVQCFQCQSLEHVCPQCPKYICPFCQRAAPGHPQQTCPMRSCPICGELGHVGTTCPTATAACSPSLPPEWVTSGDLELVSQCYEGGNVMVEGTPTSFSPFSSVDCTLISHFLFNDFISVAFPDLAGDLDTQF